MRPGRIGTSAAEAAGDGEDPPASGSSDGFASASSGGTTSSPSGSASPRSPSRTSAAGSVTRTVGGDPAATIPVAPIASPGPRSGTSERASPATSMRAVPVPSSSTTPSPSTATTRPPTTTERPMSPSSCAASADTGAAVVPAPCAPIGVAPAGVPVRLAAVRRCRRCRWRRGEDADVGRRSRHDHEVLVRGSGVRAADDPHHADAAALDERRGREFPRRAAPRPGSTPRLRRAPRASGRRGDADRRRFPRR